MKKIKQVVAARGQEPLFVKLPSLQFFAAGENNDLPVRSFQKEFKELLPTVYAYQSYMQRLFVGEIETLDGVKNNQTAFSIKTSDIPVVVGTYDTSSSIAFGNGTSASSRFGQMKEIIYTDQDVPYDFNWAFHEGIDLHTVNNDVNDAIMDRLELQARAKAEMLDQKHAQFFFDNAKVLEYNSVRPDADGVGRAFDELAAYYRNNRIVGNRIALVSPVVYNAIVSSVLTTTAKRSSVNIDTNEVLKFKGFEIIEAPADLFINEVTQVYTFIEGIAKAFLGINTARTINAIDFEGVQLQGSGKGGQFIPEDNKKALYRVEFYLEQP